MQGAVLQDGFRRQGLKYRARNDPAVWDAEAIAQFQGRTANDDLLAPQICEGVLLAAQHVDIGHFRNRCGADTEIDQEGDAALRVSARQHSGHRGNKLPCEAFPKGVMSDKPIWFDRDVYDCRPRMIGELLQRTINVDCGIAAGLLERRQDDRSAAVGKRIDKIQIRRWFGRRAKIDVECNVAHAGAFQPPDELGVQPSRPRPDSDLFNRCGIDRNNDDLAARVARLPGETKVGQSVADYAVPAGQQHRRQRKRDKNMWPVLLQVYPPAHHYCRSAPPSCAARISD